MAYTKYSLTPGSNTAAPPDGAPEGMLPSAVNDTMRDMMAQIRDCGDGIRGGTYTMTAPVITGGSVSGASGSFTSLAYSTTLTGGTGIVNLGSGQFYKDASGNVGIGTTSPVSIAGYTLQTINNATNGGGVYLQSNGTSIGRILNTTTDMFVGGVSASSALVLQSGGAERMRITSTGLVGIGTSSPSAPLTVYSARYDTMRIGRSMPLLLQ